MGAIPPGIPRVGSSGDTVMNWCIAKALASGPLLPVATAVPHFSITFHNMATWQGRSTCNLLPSPEPNELSFVRTFISTNHNISFWIASPPIEAPFSPVIFIHKPAQKNATQHNNTTQPHVVVCQCLSKFTDHPPASPGPGGPLVTSTDSWPALHRCRCSCAARPVASARQSRSRAASEWEIHRPRHLGGVGPWGRRSLNICHKMEIVKVLKIYRVWVADCCRCFLEYVFDMFSLGSWLGKRFRTSICGWDCCSKWKGPSVDGPKGEAIYDARWHVYGMV